ncbi:MAG: DegV family protein [Eubacteriales bacterium]|nr:DegV family protein [Eubacteriales bacterium]
MGKIILVAESGCDVTADLRERYGIRIVPMHVIFGDTIRDDGTFPPSEVLDYFRKTNKIPTTSGAMIYDFSRVFDEIMISEPEASVLHIAYSAVTTCSYDCARQAAEERPQMPFAQVDTGMFSYGHYSVVIRMAQMLEQHPEWTLKDAQEAAQDLVNHSCMAFVPDGFDFLRASGRVRNTAALVGELLRIHPRVDQVNGYLVPGKRYRGRMDRVIQAMIRDFVRDYETERPEIWLGHTPEFADAYKKAAEDTVRELGFTMIHWIECGCVITTHGGTGCFGLSGFGKAVR